MPRNAAPKTKNPASGSATRAHFQEMGTALCAALLGVLGQVGGGERAGIRPVVLSRSLRLDDSLSARILRSVRSSDPLSVLRELPAPAGLRLFLEAARKNGASAAACETADGEVARLERLLSQLPLGRASMNTAIDGWLPSGRARAEAASKQAVFKALSQTLGFTVDTVCFASIIQPSAAGDMCDAVTFVAMDGIRRLREGAPILLYGHSPRHNEPSSHAGPTGIPPLPTPVLESLDGEREVTDARKLVLADVGDSAALPLKLIERPLHTRVVLDSGARRSTSR
ncbi:MAG: hypothetical protein QM783_10125 [Phycisphaerales bacterium]